MQLRRRREIRKWSSQQTARKDYDCVKCDTTIHATEVYTRAVYAGKTTIEPEATHASPDCPNRYY